MSHFSVLVFVKDHTNYEDELTRLLAPYDENINVPEYDKPCYCIGKKAAERARKLADQRFGSIDKLRFDFAQKRLATLDPESGEWKAGHAGIEKAWREFIAPRRAFEGEVLGRQKDQDAPDPDCEECQGTGTRRSTYNPKSKWDWYVVGGRWTGWLGGYDPEKDARNYKTCDLCSGTGYRNDQLGIDRRKQDPTYTCNGCSGSGKMLTFPTDWPDIGNTLKVSEIPDDKIPFAILTPDGEWHENGSMGWWGIVSEEKDADHWAGVCHRLYQQYADYYAVCVDCHI